MVLINIYIKIPIKIGRPGGSLGMGPLGWGPWVPGGLSGPRGGPWGGPLGGAQGEFFMIFLNFFI